MSYNNSLEKTKKIREQNLQIACQLPLSIRGVLAAWPFSCYIVVICFVVIYRCLTTIKSVLFLVFIFRQADMCYIVLQIHNAKIINSPQFIGFFFWLHFNCLNEQKNNVLWPLCLLSKSYKSHCKTIKIYSRLLWLFLLLGD